MIAVMVGPSRLPALQYMTPAAYAWRQVGYSSSRTGSVAWTARALAACHGATVSSQAGPRAWHGSTQPSASPTHGSRLDLTLDMEALQEARQDRYRTATAMVVWGRCQQCSVTQACRSVLAEQPIGSVVASQACHGVMLASVLVVVCSLA